jgi:transposase
MKRGKYIYLAECKSVREGKKVRTVTIRYLGREGDQKVVPADTKQEPYKWKPPERSSRHGDVALLWQLAEDLKISQTIDRICLGKSEIQGISPGKLLTIWAINRVIDPQSATQLDQWIQTTSLPSIIGFSSKNLRKDDFYAALDAVAYFDRNLGKICENISRIEEMLYSHWRDSHPLPLGEEEVIAYDLTAVPYFGDTCPLAANGYNASHSLDKQIKMGVLISKFDKLPISHQIYPGNFNDIITMEGIVPKLNDFAIKEGTLVWDRGNTSKQTVTTLERYGWELICGVAKRSKEAIDIVSNIDVTPNLENHVPCGKKGHIYAILKTAKLFGEERNVVVYLNLEKSTRCLAERNYKLNEISDKLKNLQDNKDKLSSESIKKMVNVVLKDYKKFFEIIWKEDDKPCFTWEIKHDERILAEKTVGKYLLYATNKELSAQDVVMMYLNKDYVEKFFRDTKSENEISPIRHQLEPRVRASMFVGVLAYRLKAALAFLIKSSKSKDITHSPSEFIRLLGRVERVEVKHDDQSEFFFFNLTKKLKDQVVALNMKNLFSSKDQDAA